MFRIILREKICEIVTVQNPNSFNFVYFSYSTIKLLEDQFGVSVENKKIEDQFMVENISVAVEMKKQRPHMIGRL